MTLVQIERHKKIVEYCSKLLVYALEKDVEFINKMMSDSDSFLTKANKNQLKVHNPTEVELGYFRAMCKKIIRSHFVSKKIREVESRWNDENDTYCNFRYDVYGEFDIAILKTKFKQSTVDKYILLMRSAINASYYNQIQIAIRDAIHLEVLSQFQKQNKKLITKYI